MTILSKRYKVKNTISTSHGYVLTLQCIRIVGSQKNLTNTKYDKWSV